MDYVTNQGQSIRLKDDVVTSVAATVALAKAIDEALHPGFFKIFQAHMEHVYRATEDAEVPNIIDNAQVLSMGNYFCSAVERAELEGEYGRFSENQGE